MKLPKKYLAKNPRVMRKEIEKHAHKRDDDPSAYKEWDADYKSRKAGKGKKVETKTSKYTKKYKEMFGESESMKEFESNILTYEQYQEQLQVAFLEAFQEVSELGEEALNEGVDDISSPVNKALKKKSDQTRFPLGILKQVWKRGYAAWKTGHVPGTTPQQWAMARVNSFVTGGKTTKMHDKALYKRAKANLKQKKKK
jgi:hypothetical protein